MDNHRILNEYEIVQTLSATLIERGYNVLLEVPFLGRSIDMVLQSETSTDPIAIEFKIKDGVRVLEQAQRLKFASDMVFIAMPEKRLSQSILAKAAAMGIGVFAITDENEVMLSMKLMPRKAGKKIDFAKEWLNAGILFAQKELEHAR